MDNNRKRLHTLRKYFRKYRHYYYWGIVVLVGTNAVGLAVPWLLKHGIDGLKAGESLSTLFWLALGILAAAIVSGVFRFFSRRTIIWASRHIEYDLRNELFNHLLKLSASFYQKTTTGDLIARSSNDMEAVRMMAGPAVMYLINAIIGSIMVLAVMTYLSPKLTFYVLIPLPVLSVLMWQISLQVHKRFRKIQDHFSFMSSFVQEHISGIRVIKAYLRELYQEKRFAEINDKYVDLNMSLARVRAFFMPSITFLAGTALLLFLWAGGHEVINGTISLGGFVAFQVYLTMLIWPMLAFGFVMSIYQRGTASLARIDDILTQDPDVADDSHPTSIQGDGRIRFSNLSFTYPDTETPVLKDVSFEVKKGQRLAIVGATGSGKSTLASLLVRRFPVPEGTLFIDDVDVNRIPLDDLRGMIGFVRQESYLFSDTIAANIGLGSKKTDEDEIRQAALMAAFESEVESLPNDYQTLLGERGVTLSGGQKQRAAIARALLKRPKILVLDDAFSSVDTQTEELILEHLTTYLADMTMLIISHRPSTIRRADSIVVLDKGTIVERGTHDELISRQGRYYDIIRKELLASELEMLD
jgi:ATP-binding cassette subfamily B multidrug efflux pump